MTVNGSRQGTNLFLTNLFFLGFKIDHGLCARQGWAAGRLIREDGADVG